MKTDLFCGVFVFMVEICAHKIALCIKNIWVVNYTYYILGNDYFGIGI